MELEIPVYWHTDETSKSESMGLDFDPSELEHRVTTFYRIDSIAPCEYGCYIYCGGERWISPLSYAELKEKIK